MTLVALFLFTVFAGLAGAIWEWVGISRLLKRDHPEESGGIPYPALTKKIMESARDPKLPPGLTFPTPGAPFRTTDVRVASVAATRPIAL